ncbi:MAG: hypothetical protein RMJ51_03565 [Candidatus Calescibacterium sp.]|nr:hypothetical protein [Candidatus Calescibacterium sp.]MDW8195303.1 hypothetical protein [Candidatus Calescibacterium sp.]
MINIKFRLLDSNIQDHIYNAFVEVTNSNLLKERKYTIGNVLCVYRIDDFVSDKQRIFVFNFYYEKTGSYDFKQTFVSKLFKKSDELIYLIHSIGYIFITDNFVKSFGNFWDDIYSDIFNREGIQLIYKNFL